MDVDHDVIIGEQAGTSAIGDWKSDRMSLVLAVISGGALLLLLLLLFLPLVSSILGMFNIHPAALTNMLDWLSGGSRRLIIVLVLATIAAASFLLLRMQILNNRALYVSEGCPQCSEHDLIRVRRQKSDRVLARFGFPVRRYVCRNCSWDGLRFGLPAPHLNYLSEEAGVDLAEIEHSEAL
ncbi:MAG: hypothetical protein ACK2UK_01910 [Candidatus Promineifilaceae bacterium]